MNYSLLTTPAQMTTTLTVVDQTFPSQARYKFRCLISSRLA